MTLRMRHGLLVALFILGSLTIGYFAITVDDRCEWLRGHDDRHHDSRGNDQLLGATTCAGPGIW
jgi:hypothetical protein